MVKDGKILVNEIFESIDGEGYHAGFPTVSSGLWVVICVVLGVIVNILSTLNGWLILFQKN